MNLRISATPTRRRWVAALVAVAAVAGCTDPGPRTRDVPSEAPTPVQSQDELLFVDGARLKRANVGDGTITRGARLPGPDVAASPATAWVAVVTGTSTGADDFLETPMLRLLDVTSGAEIDLGIGYSPMWHPSDDRLAYLQPVEPRRCEVETCRGGAAVVTWRPGSAPTELTPPGRWGLLGWAGDHLLVADGGDLSHTVVAGPTGRASLAVPPSEVWDASPDGRWLVTVGVDGAQFRRLEDGALAGAPIDISAGAALLGDGSWAPDSTRIAATMRGQGRSRVAVIAPSAPVARDLPGSGGAAGAVLWSPTGKAVAFPQSGAGGRRLRAAYCRVEGSSPCRSLFSWDRDVVLLRME